MFFGTISIQYSVFILYHIQCRTVNIYLQSYTSTWACFITPRIKADKQCNCITRITTYHTSRYSHSYLFANEWIISLFFSKQYTRLFTPFLRQNFFRAQCMALFSIRRHKKAFSSVSGLSTYIISKYFTSVSCTMTGTC